MLSGLMVGLNVLEFNFVHRDEDLDNLVSVYRKLEHMEEFSLVVEKVSNPTMVNKYIVSANCVRFESFSQRRQLLGEGGRQYLYNVHQLMVRKVNCSTFHCFFFTAHHISTKKKCANLLRTKGLEIFL